jgi:curved DNA-binding protein
MDYYATLGISQNAGQDEIKKAFRKLARQYHPDVNKDDPEAEAKFKAINEAHEVLTDPEKRALYDRYGVNWRQVANGQGQTYTQTVDPEAFRNFNDIFADLFGASFGGHYPGGGRGPAFAGQDVEYTVELTLDEALHGTTRTLRWDGGRTVEARIPPGVRDGSRVRLQGQGEPGYNGGPAGDLYLVVQMQPDARFERQGDDLKVTLPVDLYTALLGGSVSVTGLDKTVNLNIPEGTANGRVFRLKGMGMPNLKNPSQRGNLLVRVEVQLPEKLSGKEKALFRQLRELRETV